jgi:outer membrane lipoprotein-sorting protein
MKSFLLTLVVAATLAALPASGASEADGEGTPLQSLLSELETNLGSMLTLRADFVQEQHLSILADVGRSEGVLLFSRPGRVRIETLRPYRSILMCSGGEIARYEHFEGAWRKLDAGDAAVAAIVTGQIGGWMEGRFSDGAEAFDISARMDDETVIVLAPSDERIAKFVKAVELTVNKERTAITSVKVEEPGGDYTLIRFTREVRGTKLDDALFDTSRRTPVELDAANAPGAKEAANE